ncbi:C2 family cysteine protease [Chryseobacterium profundimaris]|uniref:Calpain family cysteine protease n=1 Tax=Chryseobacterium profundimaris TaxID=1387275 RepID=A0ABY1N952_9FLAO|nr:C2 family cysteine protease [Chryseobacterium profundimaris]SMP03849.1 Calpain family cysteine protease [Chryseobacterium profundimaris]
MDQAPKEMFVGVINPYALTEAITGRKFDWKDAKSYQILEETLETNYSELFDIKFNSPLYAGLELTKDNTVRALKSEEVKIRATDKLESVNLSNIKTLNDLSTTGIKDLNTISVKNARLDKGDVKMVLNIPKLNNTINNKLITPSIRNIIFGQVIANGWTPAGTSWSDRGNFFNDVTEYNDPVQGAIGNCYFIAAISAIAWAAPYTIEHKVRATGTGETDRTNAIQFFTKGGGKDAATRLVEVTDNTIINASNNPVYCRSNDAGEIWPAVYEKAFAKWITNVNHDKPDITQTAYGDPAKAIAQLTNKTPYYYNTSSRTALELFGVVRENSMSYKTFNPMVAWTYGSGKDYTGSNIVGNHAYTVLGWSTFNNKNYIILRNPWGVTEPNGLNSYQGLISFFDGSFWRPINMIGNDGVFALEINAFKNYFAALGVAK